jgi:hypothetical protein
MTEEMPEPGSRFVVFNDVTQAVEESDQDPSLGDPNAGIQAAVMSAYSGGTGSSLSAASTTADVPTPAVLGAPAAEVFAAVQSAGTQISNELRAQLLLTMGPLAAIGQIPGMIGQMASNARMVLNNTTRVFEGINRIFQPEQEGTTGRCASLGDFLGSLQGRFNGALNSITSGLSTIANALISVPLSVLNGFAAAANAVVSAIASGVSQVINTALNTLTSVANTVVGALGKVASAALNQVGALATQVLNGLRAEADNLLGALRSLTLSPFKLVVPQVNICMKDILQSNPASASLNTGVAAQPVAPGFG